MTLDELRATLEPTRLSLAELAAFARRDEFAPWVCALLEDAVAALALDERDGRALELDETRWRIRQLAGHAPAFEIVLHVDTRDVAVVAAIEHAAAANAIELERAAS